MLPCLLIQNCGLFSSCRRSAAGRKVWTLIVMSAGKERTVFYLDDLQVGQRFTSGTHLITGDEFKALRRQCDPQPVHLDEATAKDTLFGGLVASGWHTASITMRLLVESGLPLAGGIIGAQGEIAWPNPTRP